MDGGSDELHSSDLIYGKLRSYINLMELADGKDDIK